MPEVRLKDKVVHRTVRDARLAKRGLDTVDLTILKHLQNNSKVPLDKIATAAGVPKATIHYRIKRLERTGAIQGYYAKVDPILLGKDYVAVSLIRGKYGPRYHERLGKKLAAIPGVWVVYFLFGDWDFLVITRSNNREDLSGKVETIINMKEVERGATQIVSRVVKEDPRVEV
jgi:Lrp/AsnC family leucine-responsive transcriptional regulator